MAAERRKPACTAIFLLHGCHKIGMVERNDIGAKQLNERAAVLHLIRDIIYSRGAGHRKHHS